MKQKTLMKIAFIFSVIGTLFSGYLTFSKLITGGCTITEGCADFLGYPTCYYGFVMFLILTILSAKLFFGKPNETLKKILLIVAVIGILFSLYYTAIELPTVGTIKYSLFLPTCVYALVMYLIIFVAALLGLYKK